ncbi:Membrane Metallo-Endopeptidase-Like 1 [Manis pentadactyla]|nr:Membrane Metallo-Endopeptidase-Like 1 [Manis pentadactyla]
MSSRFRQRVLFDLFVWNDDQNSSQRIIYVVQPTLGMPSCKYYLKDGTNRKLRAAYLQFMVSVATMLREDMNLPKNSHLVQNDVAQGFNWALFTQSVLSSVRIKLPADEEVGVCSIPYLQNLEHIISVSSARAMQNYLVWHLVLDRISGLGQRFKDARANHLRLNLLEDQHFENRLQNLAASAHRSPKRLWEKADRNLKEQPQALSFGGIGMVIRHEITHGFDDDGRNFDMDGNMHDWWSKRSARPFRRQAECMTYPYGNYSWDLAEKQTVNGFSTLGENIADNGGVRQAYKVRPTGAPGGGGQQKAHQTSHTPGGQEQPVPPTTVHDLKRGRTVLGIPHSDSLR